MNTPNSYNDELLSAYLDGELTGDEQALVEERLASDPSAQQLLDDLAMMREDLQSLPTYSLPHDLSERVLQQAEHEMLMPRNDSPMPISKEAPTSWQKPAWALLVAGAAASIAFVIFYGPGGDEGPRVAGGPPSSESSTGPLHASGEVAEDNVLASSSGGIGGGGKGGEEFYLQGRDSEENGKRVDDDFAYSNQKLPATNGPVFKGRRHSKKGGNAGEDRFGNLANGSEFDLDAVAGQGTYEGKDVQGVANGLFYAGTQATANGRQPLPDNTYTVAMTTGDFREQVIEQSLRYQELTSPTLLGTVRFASPTKQLSGGAVAKATDDRKLDLDGDASESAAPDLAEHRQGKNDAKAKDAGVEQKEDSSPRYVFVEGTPEQINKLLAKLGPAAVETPSGKYGLQESALKTNSRRDEHHWHSTNDSVDEKQPEVQDRPSNAAKDQPQNNAPISPAKPATPNTIQPQAKPTDPTPEPTVVAPIPPGAPRPVPPTSNLANGDDPFDSPIGKNASPADKSEPGRSEGGQGAASDPNTVNSPKTAGNFRSKADNQTLQEESPNADPSEAEGEESEVKTQRGTIVENANRSLDGHLKESQQVLDQTVVTPKSEVTANEENATQGERLDQSIVQSKGVAQDDSEKREPSQSFSLNANRRQSRGTVRVLFVLYDAPAVRANSSPSAAQQAPASR